MDTDIFYVIEIKNKNVYLVNLSQFNGIISFRMTMDIRGAMKFESRIEADKFLNDQSLVIPYPVDSFEVVEHKWM